ncbi:MAG: hypothetical protein QNL62_13030 [Gammaproteobacteria bacterium]|nr:hypothetical protein [Gammaproteobacteria bacterium]
MIKNTLLLFITLLALASCFANETEADKTEQKNVTECTEPRPVVCTMDYTPVCALNKDGVLKTYSNGCGACSNPDVVSYVPLACPDNN